MIKDLSKRHSRLNIEDYINSDVPSESINLQNFSHNIADYDKYNSNPFEIKNKKENDVQKYFNNVYNEVNFKIKNTLFKLDLKVNSEDSIKKRIKDIIIECSSVVAKYFYDKNLKMNVLDTKTYLISKEKNIYSVTVQDENQKQLIQFTNSSMLKIEEIKNNEKIVLSFYKQNYFEKLFSLNKDCIKKYQKFNSLNQLTEEVYFTKSQKPEKYIKYELNKKKYEIIFDTTDWQVLSKDILNNRTIPLEYLEYNYNETLVAKMTFQYAKPDKYIEYNSNTGKMTKMFSLQGLYHLVSKYSFYNSITGQILAFGTF